MELAKKIVLLFLFFATLALILAGCSEKEDSENKVYEKPAEQKWDSLTTYFSTIENFTNKDYLPTFYNHFNEKLNKKKWEEAAQLLFCAGESAISNDISDSLLLHVHIDFINKRTHYSTR